MFLDEARIVARLHHPQIVRIFDLGQTDGAYYIAMEYIAGEDQASVIQQAKRQKLQLPLPYAAEVAIGAAEALMSAHQMVDAGGQPMQLVHRDVSPSNIIATWQGSVKLVDFGIARTEANISKTEGGRVKGKVQYLSPEQCRGVRADSRTDLYALGVVLFELITCTRLFLRDSPFATVKAITRPTGLSASWPPGPGTCTMTASRGFHGPTARRPVDQLHALRQPIPWRPTLRDRHARVIIA
jgi:serine/threonine-protein kinase